MSLRPSLSRYSSSTFPFLCDLICVLSTAVDVLNLAQWANAATLQCFADGTSVNCLSWSTGRFEPPTLVVGGSFPAVYRYTEASRQWSPVLLLPEPPSHKVKDVAWAPNVGRSFHYVASCEDTQLRIFKLSRGYTNAEGDGMQLVDTQTISLPHAWRCQWNVTGTVLAVGGDCGTVDLYKMGPEGLFRRVSQIQGDLSKVAAHGSA